MHAMHGEEHRGDRGDGFPGVAGADGLVHRDLLGRAMLKGPMNDIQATGPPPASRDRRGHRCDEMTLRATDRIRLAAARANARRAIRRASVAWRLAGPLACARICVCSLAGTCRDARDPSPLPGHPMTDTLLKKSENNLIWVDMEMTGLLPDTDRIIEVAVVITDPHLTIRVEGPVFAIHQSDATLDAMDAWNKGTHGRSGLIERVKASTVTEEQAQAELIEWMSQYVPKGKSPMCGNSICQDRRFMARTMPRLEEFFHYRNLDVSTLKELAKRWKPSVLDGLKKAGKHTALADIQESIDELVHYRANLLAL
jgi:oligoribonuclease